MKAASLVEIVTCLLALVAPAAIAGGAEHRSLDIVGRNRVRLSSEATTVIDLEGCAASPGVTEVAVLFDAPAGQGRVLLLDTNGPSRLTNPEGHCGMGQERALVWLRLDPHGKVVATQSVNYEGCDTPVIRADQAALLEDARYISLTFRYWPHLPPSCPHEVVRVLFDRQEPGAGLLFPDDDHLEGLEVVRWRGGCSVLPREAWQNGESGGG